MKCLYCGYEQGWSNEKMAMEEGKHGDFYILSNDIEATRYKDGDDETKKVYACPACGKMFIRI